MSLNVLSLFSGIGGLELGLERAGMTVVGQVEIDEFCRSVLAKHWPEVARHDDVRTAVEWWQSEPRPTVDVICGGFPCQDISNAGRRAGIINGERSSLWAHLAATVRALRPRYVLVENVTALLVRGLDVVLADLAEIGYDAEWDCIPAAAVGAPHRRDRWFGIAYPKREQLRLEPISEPGCFGPTVVAVDGQERDVADAGAYWTAVWSSPLAHTESQRCRALGSQSAGKARTDDFAGHASEQRGSHAWAVEPDVGRVADGVPSRVDRLRALGNAVVPQVAEYVGRLIVAADNTLAVSR